MDLTPFKTIHVTLGARRDERNPAPFLCATWAAWELFQRARCWLWMRISHPVERLLDSTGLRSRPRELTSEPTDADGRTLR